MDAYLFLIASGILKKILRFTRCKQSKKFVYFKKKKNSKSVIKLHFSYKHNGYKHIQAQIWGNLKQMQIDFLSSKELSCFLTPLLFKNTSYERVEEIIGIMKAF